MSSYTTRTPETAPQRAPEVSSLATSWAAPSWSPLTETETATGTLSDEQRALDESAASEADLTEVHVASLSAFGIRPSELDELSARRLAAGLDRMTALLACEGGAEAACADVGPGLVGHEATDAGDGGHRDELVVEDDAFTLTIRAWTDPVTGATERRLLYQDIDGSFVSGISAEPLEILAGEAAEDSPETAPEFEEGIGSFFEGALLGDFSDNDSWSALAGQTAIGFVPIAGQIADVRDTAAAIKKVVDGEEGAWLQLAAAGLAWVPGLDVLKGGAHLAAQLGTEAAEQGVQRMVKEGAEAAAAKAAKEAAHLALRELDPAVVAHLTEELGAEQLAQLAAGMGGSAGHNLDLASTIARVGPEALVAAVRRDGVEAMVRYGPEALGAVGRETMDRAASATALATVDNMQLQKKWKHAEDFGISGPWRGSDTAAQAAYVEALNATIRDADEVFVGPYSGMTVIHYFQGDKVVLTTVDGTFISGWANAADKLTGVRGLAPPNGSRYFRAR